MTMERRIKQELAKALERLGADRELLATVESWGDTIEDERVLTELERWNRACETGPRR
jgi:hypothetical protein